MDEPKRPETERDLRRVPLHRRIRNRREELGLTALELARIVRVSPSYISLIESGEKVPGEEVAVRIARALRDDEGLYVAWTHSTRHGDPERQLRDLARLRDYSSDPALRERLVSGEDLDEVESESGSEDESGSTWFLPGRTAAPRGDRRSSEWDGATWGNGPPSRPNRTAADVETTRSGRSGEDENGEEPEFAVESDDRFESTALGSPALKPMFREVDDAILAAKRLVGGAGQFAYTGVIEIPILADGADPGEDPSASPGVIDTVRFDPRALPLETTGRLFAYRPRADFLERVGALIKPGDLVILTSTTGRLAPDRIHAVRREGEIVLSRVLFKRDALLLLPGEDSARIDVIDLAGREELVRAIAGSVVTTVRNWGPGKRKASQRRLADTRSAKAGAVASWPREIRSLVSALGDELPHKARSRRGPPRWRSAELQGRHLVRDCEWRPRYGWRPLQRAADLDFLEENPGLKVRFRLIREGEVRFHLEMDAQQWRAALGDYVHGSTWYRNGYIVPVTKMREGEYTEEFKERWAPYARRVG
jgi:transcriptional regulator with XRE-family HTH domain